MLTKRFCQNAKGPIAVEMAYRANELKGGDQTYPVSGTKRGSSQYNDIYYYTGIRISISLINYKMSRKRQDGLSDQCTMRFVS